MRTKKVDMVQENQFEDAKVFPYIRIKVNVKDDIS